MSATVARPMPRGLGLGLSQSANVLQEVVHHAPHLRVDGVCHHCEQELDGQGSIDEGGTMRSVGEGLLPTRERWENGPDEFLDTTRSPARRWTWCPRPGRRQNLPESITSGISASDSAESSSLCFVGSSLMRGGSARADDGVRRSRSTVRHQATSRNEVSPPDSE